jgi:hypothetical protein
MSVVKSMRDPVIALLAGFGPSLFGYIWVLPFAVGSAVALVILILARDSGGKEKRGLVGIAMTFFFLGLALLAAGAVSVFLV